MKFHAVLFLNIFVFSLIGFCQTKEIELNIYSTDSLKIYNSSISIEYKNGSDVVEIKTTDTLNQVLYTFDCTKDYLIIVHSIGYYTSKLMLESPCDRGDKIFIFLENIIKLGNNHSKKE